MPPEVEAELAEPPETQIVVDPPEDQVVDPAESVAEPEPPAEPAKPEKKPRNPLIDELTQQRARRREAEEGRAKAEREAADYKALAERLSKGDGKEGAGEPPKATTRDTSDDAEVDRRADYKLFLRDVASIKDRGAASFGQDEFKSTIDSLAAYGADNDEFVKAVMAVDGSNAHELLHEIAQDGARAIGLVNMTPTQRIAELTRMSVARSTKTAPVAAVDTKPAAGKSLSAAPRPAPAIAASTTQQLPTFSDKKTDKEFDADFNGWAKRFNRR